MNIGRRVSVLRPTCVSELAKLHRSMHVILIALKSKEQNMSDLSEKKRGRIDNLASYAIV